MFCHITHKYMIIFSFNHKYIGSWLNLVEVGWLNTCHEKDTCKDGIKVV